MIPLDGLRLPDCTVYYIYTLLTHHVVRVQRMAEMQRAAQFAHPQHGAPPPFFQPPPR